MIRSNKRNFLVSIIFFVISSRAQNIDWIWNTNLIPKSGPYVTSYFKSNTAELSYVEQMIPKTGDHVSIYYSSCNFFIGDYGGYAGLQHIQNNSMNGINSEYINICSIWDSKSIDSSLPTEAKLTFGTNGLNWKHFEGEGTGLHTSYAMNWSPDQWYSTVIRRWYIPGEEVTRMAMFMYSHTQKIWTHYMSATVPQKDVPLKGNLIGSFLERFLGTALGYHGIYGQHYRMSKNGEWEKPEAYVASAGGDPSHWKAMLVDSLYIKLTAGGIYANTNSEIKFEPNQILPKPKPVIPPVVIAVNATYRNVKKYAVNVEWEISIKHPPQLQYFIKIYGIDMDGELIAGKSGIAPEKRKEVIETGALMPGTYYITFEFDDIFNQRSNLVYEILTVV